MCVGECRDRAGVCRPEWQLVPESIKALRSAHENLTGLDGVCQLKNSNNFQLTSVENPFVVGMIMNEGMPFARQVVWSHVINVYVITLRRFTFC